MTKRRGHGHGHGRKNKRTMRRRRSHSAHLTRSRRHHRHGSRSRARRGGLVLGHLKHLFKEKGLKHLSASLDERKRQDKIKRMHEEHEGNRVSYNTAQTFQPSTNRPNYSSSVMQTLRQLGTVPSPSSRGAHAASSAYNMSP